MASSAIYRYVASRDELLTLLLIDGYNDLGGQVEDDEAAVERSDLRGRFVATAASVRRWGLANPQIYALLYGSPVPGYVAPVATIPPATRVTLLLGRILVDAAAFGGIDDEDPGAVERVGLDVEAIRGFLPGVPDGAIVQGIEAWAEIFGLVSFELFGHLVGSVGDNERFFLSAVGRMATRVGLKQ